MLSWDPTEWFELVHEQANICESPIHVFVLEACSYFSKCALAICHFFAASKSKAGVQANNYVASPELM